MGADGNLKDKFAHAFFDQAPSKMLPGGSSLKTMRVLQFKYAKASQELRVTGTYRWVAKPKPKAIPALCSATDVPEETVAVDSEPTEGDYVVRDDADGAEFGVEAAGLADDDDS